MGEIDAGIVGQSASAPVAELPQPNVLLVDDQPARLLTYESILEGVGVNCVRAQSGKEALDRLLKQPFAVILLDVHMPGMDGFETARMIREHPRFEHTPIIFVTGAHLTELDKLRGYEAGAIDYMPVPIVPEILRSKVALLVELYRRRAQLEALNRELELARARLEKERNDILAATRAKEAERAEKEWLAAVLNSMNEEVYFTDTQKRYTYANPAALREFGHATVAGVQVEKIIANLEVLRPDGTPRPIEEAPPLRSLAGEVIRGEEQIVRIPRTGELRHRQVSSAPVRDATGTIIGSVSVVRDITDQRRVDAAFRLRDARSTALLKLTDEFRWLTAPGDLAYAAARILGETLGASRCGYGTIDPLAETITIERDWNAPGIDSIAGVLQFREYGSYVDELKRGETVVCVDAETDSRTRATADRLQAISARSFVNMPITERGGTVALLYLNHATVRPWLAEELAFMREVAERTRVAVERRRSEEALRQSEQQLRDADRRKDEFIAMLAHELRNPLVPIRTGVELLKNAREQPALIDTVRPMMERQIEHMVRLIDDLLDVSRITSGKIELRPQPVTLASVIDSAIEANRAAIAAGNLDLTVNLAEPTWVLNVDPTRFAQVVSNLLQNATKFTAGGGRIAIDATIEAAASAGARPDETWLVLKVTDSGIGIAAEMLPRVFELFAQVRTSGQGRQGGLGIGLALARRLVEMHGGTIDVRSDGVGRGSEFTIRLPVPRNLQPFDAARRSADRTLEGFEVLVVDDNHDAADAMVMLVQAMGGVARVAYDGASALAMLTELQPAIVLLDIGMPGMDGYETCRLIRQRRGMTVGIIALSGWGQEQDKRLAAQAGFDAHLTKPADPTKLEETILALGARV